MSDNIQKISRVLLHPTRNFFLRIHVKLLKEKDGRKENFHSLFVSEEGNGYLTLDLQSFLTLEIKDGLWTPDKSILIDQRNIYQVIKGMEKSLDKIYNGTVFAKKKSGETVMFKEELENHTVRIYNIGQNQRLVIQPAIVYDDNETTYEGVIMFLNKTENYVELPIDAFEALYHTLKETNMFVYSQLLLNYYMTTIKGEKVELKQVTVENKSKPKKKHPLSSTTDEEFTKSNIKINKSAQEFFGFKKED